jgi:serine/threonine protein kinase
MSGYLGCPIGLSHADQIGTGATSQVHLVRDPDTGKLIAVKYFSGGNLDKGGFIQEVESLAALNHPCVLKIIRWALPNDRQPGQIHTEYVEQGSLCDVLRRKRSERDGGFWTPTKIGIVICDIVIGMRFVHFRGIIHRDLKPSNILIRGSGRALIGDFGSSRFKDDDGTITGATGTVHYAAPELFDETAFLTPKVDVWGFGLILYEIVSGFPVFPTSLSPFDVIRQMQSHHRPDISSECGEYMRGMIQRCWSDDPASRPSFEAILREFRARRFAILPAVDGEEIFSAVDGVLRWELDARVSPS